MHPSGRHKTIQMDAEECPPLGLGGGARAFIKALSEGSGVPAFVLYDKTTFVVNLGLWNALYS